MSPFAVPTAYINAHVVTIWAMTTAFLLSLIWLAMLT